MKIRRLLRFSLRTLAIALTLICIWLGWKVEQTRRQRQAIDSIRELGGNVYFKHHYSSGGLDQDATPSAPEWLRPVFGDGEIEVVDFTLQPLSDDDLQGLPKQLERLPRFRLLSLDRTQIGDATVERLKDLGNFRMLNLDSTGITDTGIEHLLDMPQLEVLAIVFADNVTDAGLKRLVDHPNLREVAWNRSAEPAEMYRVGWIAYRELQEALEKRDSGP